MIFLFYCKVWTLTLVCETQHHLNYLYAKYCQHWFFWDIDTYWEVYNLRNVGFYVVKSWRFICINTVFGVATQKKSNSVKSHDLGSQLISPRRGIMRALFAPVMWQVALFCWNHKFSKSYSLIANKNSRLSCDHNAPNWRSIVGLEEVRYNHTFGSKSASDSVIFWFLRTPNTTILFINIATEYEMYFIAEENLLEKLLFTDCCQRPFHVSTTF